MELHFRDGGRRPRRTSPSSSAGFSRPCDRRFTRRDGPFHGGPPPPPRPFEWEAAGRREWIIREEVERRLIEVGVHRELALSRAWLHGGFGPGPFVGPDGPFVPPPPGPFFGADPFMPPPPGPFFGRDPFMPPPPLMPMGMEPNWPPPDWFGPRRRAEFGQRMLPGEERRRFRPQPKQKQKQKLELREIEPSESSEVLSSETKVSGVKRKADMIAATTERTEVQEADGDTEPAEVQEADGDTDATEVQEDVGDWSCALCQVSATSQAGLNEHLGGKKHKAKLVKCGAIKVIDDDNSGLQATTKNNGAGPSDATKKIHILVDEEMHEVVQKSNYIWCERCRVRCNNAATMAGHLRGRKHSLLNKVWTSIKAVRMNNKRKEDSAATCERKVNENDPIGIPEEDKKAGTYMDSEFSENGPFEISVEIKEEATDMAEEINENGHTEFPVGIKRGSTDIAREVNKNGPVEIPEDSKQEGSDTVMDAK